MSEFDYGAEAVGGLTLVQIDRGDEAFRFLVGIDGQFTDIDGNVWYGSTAVSGGRLGEAINGVAPGFDLTLSYFQDPDPAVPDLIAQLRAEGLDWIEGAPVTIWFQPLASVAEFYAPRFAPVRWVTRIASGLVVTANQARDRSITLRTESWAEDRNAARRIALSVAGHRQILGLAPGAPDNPSLEFMPTTDFEEEKLF